MAENVPLEDSLKHLLKCNVCLEEVNTLKALPCQHTICLTCVKQLTVRRQRFKCTICKKVSFTLLHTHNYIHFFFF